MSRHREEVRVAELSQLPVGKPCMFELPGRADEILLLHRRSGDVLAIGNRCPHKRAKLHKGDIEDLGEQLGGLCVRCPKHRKKFGGGLYVGLEDGRCHTKSSLADEGKDKKVRKWNVPTYTVRVAEGFVHVELPEEAGSSSDSSDSDDCAGANTIEPFQVTLSAVSKRADSADDVFVYDFRLENSGAFLKAAAARGAQGTAWHVALSLDGVEREYTPISDLEDVTRTQTLSLLIRLYDKGEMSKKLRAICAGARAVVSAARPTLQLSMWPRSAAALLDGELWAPIAKGKAHLGLVCAGTGVTPCVQAISFVVSQLRERIQRGKGPPGERVVGLLTCNRSTSGPLMAEELAMLEQQAPCGTVSIRHTLTEGGERSQKKPRSLQESENRYSGRVSAAMLAETLPAPRVSRPCLIVVTGPPGFAEHCAPLLRSLSYAAESILALDA